MPVDIAVPHIGVDTPGVADRRRIDRRTVAAVRSFVGDNPADIVVDTAVERILALAALAEGTVGIAAAAAGIAPGDIGDIEVGHTDFAGKEDIAREFERQPEATVHLVGTVAAGSLARRLPGR